MIRLALQQVAEVVGGELVDGADAERMIDDVTIDSRTVGAGSLFVALPGEHADGHDFIADAVDRGAAGYLQQAGRLSVGPRGGVVVDDPADALLGLGAWVRQRVNPLVVAVTGSSGKTTTKDLIAATVGSGRSVVANPGSYNNELGVPLTCCRLGAGTQTLVAEIGTRGLGDIAGLAPVLDPDIAVVTTVGQSHLATLGDVDTVARAKSELVSALSADGVAVLNADDPRVAAMAASAPGRVRTYGVDADADWRAFDVELDELARPVFTVQPPAGDTGIGVAPLRVRLALPGAHNVGNALAALAVAAEVGVDVAEAAAALEYAAVSQWRMQLLRTPDGLVILNDAYNANPSSTEAALRTLARMGTAGRRWAVLGEMAELGPGSADAHRQIGRLAARLGVEVLVVVGEAADGIRQGAAEQGSYAPEDLRRVEDPVQALEVLAGRVQPGDVVLVKASRSVGLERIPDELETQRLRGGEQ